MSGVGHRWSADEDELLRRAYSLGLHIDQVVAEIGVSVSAAFQRARKIGLRHRRRTRSLGERFMDYVSPEPNSGCWLWEGSCDRRGYAQLRVSKNVLKYATHVALELDGHPVTTGMYACHHCDNVACVNPAHLFIGTQKDNVADMISKGRNSKPPTAKPGQGMQEFCHKGHPIRIISSVRRCRQCGIEWKAARRAAFVALGLRCDGLPRAAQS